MYRLITALFLFICASAIVGCSVAGKLFTKQEWSENYALMQGATATTPEAIDGNKRTLGEATFPEVAQGFYGASPASEVVITLPEKKTIHRIVIYSENLKTFDVAADKGEGDWELIKEVKSVESNPIDLSVRASFPTNRIRIRVLNTTDDAAVQRKQRAQTGGFRTTGNRRAAGRIYEIELYGYKSVDESKTQEETDQREKELDELLK